MAFTRAEQMVGQGAVEVEVSSSRPYAIGKTRALRRLHAHMGNEPGVEDGLDRLDVVLGSIGTRRTMVRGDGASLIAAP